MPLLQTSPSSRSQILGCGMSRRAALLWQRLSHGSITKYRGKVATSTTNQWNKGLSFRCLSGSSIADTNLSYPRRNILSAPNRHKKKNNWRRMETGANPVSRLCVPTSPREVAIIPPVTPSVERHESKWSSGLKISVSCHMNQSGCRLKTRIHCQMLQQCKFSGNREFARRLLGVHSQGENIGVRRAASWPEQRIPRQDHTAINLWGLPRFTQFER